MMTETNDSRSSGSQYGVPNVVSKATLTDGHTGIDRALVTDHPIIRHIQISQQLHVLNILIIQEHAYNLNSQPSQDNHCMPITHLVVCTCH